MMIKKSLCEPLGKLRALATAKQSHVLQFADKYIVSLLRSSQRRYLLVVLSLLIITTASAQSINDTLHEVNVRAQRKQMSNDERINTFSPGQKKQTIDSLTLQQYQLQSVANLLTQQASVFVKSYGFNGLATLSFRGASAAQSEVLWNGIPIQNAALGIADVSALPVSLMNRVSVVYGGSAALWGSGNVGGALMLENDAPVFDSGHKALSVSGGTGSYGQYMGGLRAGVNNEKWYFCLNAFAQTALNNFSYTDAAGNNMKMPNDALHSGSVLAEGAYKIGEQNIISLTAWYQQDYREIPPALFENYSDKIQQDRSLKILLDWNKQTDKNTWYIKSSFISDYMHYEDSSIALVSRNISYQYYQELGWKRKLDEHNQFLLFSPIQIAWIDLQSPDETKYQTKLAVAGAYEFNYFEHRLNVAADARGEMINNEGVFLPGGDASFALAHWLLLRGNVQRTFRAPTLNELYYNPGGNPSLKPEQGWNEDAGYTIKVKAGDFTLTHDLSVFNRNIRDWILWLGGAIWTPHNIADVHSRGMETENTGEWRLNKWKLHLGINTSYILATTVSSYIINDGSIGKEIPYAPRYSGQLNIGFTYKNLYFNYNHTYTGYRFVTTDESEYIDPYQTGNLQLMYTALVHAHTLQFTGQCNNIWNQQYQVVAFRPMPGINWLLGVKVAIL
jgi:vitamin B12 transporter